MTLRRLDTEPVKKLGIGFKVLQKTAHGYIPPYRQGPYMKIGDDIVDPHHTPLSTYRTKEPYPTGFHLFADYDDAQCKIEAMDWDEDEDALVVVECGYTDVVATGAQSLATVIQGEDKVIVARRIKLYGEMA